MVWCVATQTIGRPLSQFNFLLKLMTISCAQPSWELHLAQEVAAGLKENCWTFLTVGNAVDLAQAKCQPLRTLARQLADDKTVDASVRQAVKNVLDGDGE